MWDFFLYQIVELKCVYVDLYLGNFLVNDKGELGVLDFGCVKVIFDDFFDNYFLFIDLVIQQDEKCLIEVYEVLEMLCLDDIESNCKKLMLVFSEMVINLLLFFYNLMFDFLDQEYFWKIYQMSDGIVKDKEICVMNIVCGFKYVIYVMWIFYGLFGLLYVFQVIVNIWQDLLLINFVRCS